MLEVTNDTWLISDTHFGHDNIIKYCNRPEFHEDIILSRWVELVGPDDDVLHLGDVWFGQGSTPQYWAEILNQLPGRKRLILGNHDRSSKKYYQAAGFEIIKPFVQDRVAFTHYPMTDRSGEIVPGKPVKSIRPKYFPPEGQEWDANIHGHVHNNISRDPRLIDGKLLINISVEVTEYRPVRMGDICALG